MEPKSAVSFLSINGKLIKIIDVSVVANNSKRTNFVIEDNIHKKPDHIGDPISSDTEDYNKLVQSKKLLNEPERKTKNNFEKEEIVVLHEAKVISLQAKLRKKKIKNKLCACGICGKLISAHFLRQHKQRHKVSKTFKCTTCSKEFMTIKDLNNHKESHQQQLPFTCLVCEESFTSVFLLTCHARTHTGPSNEQEGLERETEQNCGLPATKKIPTSPTKPISKKKNRKKSNTCDICGKFFKNASYIKEHKRRHSNRKILKCTICNKGFNMVKDLNKHINSHSQERPFSCAFCEKSFKRHSLLNYHIRIHTGERPYKCDVCQMTFSRPFGLSQHKKAAHRDTNETKIKCGYKRCKREFITLRQRDAHMSVVHKGEMPYQCDFCGKTYACRVSLSYHLASIHSSETPHRCPVPSCERKFKTVSSLLLHVKAAHKDFMYKCPHCPQEFNTKGQLNKHLKTANSHKKVK